MDGYIIEMHAGEIEAYETRKVCKIEFIGWYARIYPCVGHREDDAYWFELDNRQSKLLRRQLQRAMDYQYGQIVHDFPSLGEWLEKVKQRMQRENRA